MEMYTCSCCHGPTNIPINGYDGMEFCDDCKQNSPDAVRKIQMETKYYWQHCYFVSEWYPIEKVLEYCDKCKFNDICYKKPTA